MEVPPGSNRGPEVDAYVQSVGLPPSGAYPWCAAFVHWCFAKATVEVRQPNPCPRTGSALGLWLKAKPEQRITEMAEVKPGMVFVLDLGHGTGHVGFIETARKIRFTTIEGNSNAGGSREGVGVFKRERVFSVNTLKGFLDFSR